MADGNRGTRTPIPHESEATFALSYKGHEAGDGEVWTIPKFKEHVHANPIEWLQECIRQVA